MAIATPDAPATRDPFPPDQYVFRPGVVVFAEHSATLRDGTPVRYDRRALERIAANCNRRIEETGNYAAVCIGHTERSEEDKPLVGFAGPFRVEDRNGRAVITADFHIFRDRAEALKRFPRPSPEVWIPSSGFDPDRIFLDPIAMLGAETPRLDLGMTFLYRARNGPFLCEKYAATLAGPANVHVPGSTAAPPDSTQKEPYSMAQLSPEDIQAILKAIEATDWFAALQEMIAERKNPHGDADSGPRGDDSRPEPDGDEPQTADRRKDSDAAADDGDAPSADEPRIDGGDDRPKKVEEYRRTLHYAKREDVLSAQKEIYALRQAVERERGLRVNSERRRILEGLARRYVMDVDEEMRLMVYGKASDPEFAKHCERIQRYYRAVPAETEIPLWSDAAPDYDPQSRENYSRSRERETAEKALAYAKRMINAGRQISFDEALAAVRDGRATP